MDKYWDRIAEGRFNAAHSTEDTFRSSFGKMGKEQSVEHIMWEGPAAQSRAKNFPVFLSLGKLSRDTALLVPRNAKALSPSRGLRR